MAPVEALASVIEKLRVPRATDPALEPAATVVWMKGSASNAMPMVQGPEQLPALTEIGVEKVLMPLPFAKPAVAILVSAALRAVRVVVDDCCWLMMASPHE
jgi:hypothetical protein